MILFPRGISLMGLAAIVCMSLAAAAPSPKAPAAAAGGAVGAGGAGAVPATQRLPMVIVTQGDGTTARGPLGSADPDNAIVRAAASPHAPAQSKPLPAETSRYNRGDSAGRYRDEKGKVKPFALKHGDAPLYDGGGREIGRVNKPVMLNVGAEKRMDLDGKPGKESYAWAWATTGGSGWIARDALVDPPPPDAKADRNPKPPREADTPLIIDTAAGREKLAKLRHVDSKGELPKGGGGNRGEHYAGRNPGERDYVYLLFAVPNVQRGGTAKDSLPNGSKFVPALDEKGKPIVEVMTMYRDDDLNQPVPVTFLYGRAEGGEMWGWLARANVGER